MSFPSLKQLEPNIKDLNLIHRAEDKVKEAGYNLLKKITEIYDSRNVGLQVATTESLTTGLIMSSLVDLPIGGWAKYGCFGVYDTDAKRVFNSVQVDDVYTHTCAKEMAIGLLQNSNATFAISVTGNAMPYFSDLEKLGEVFIGVAGYIKNDKGTQIVYETRSVNNCLQVGDHIGKLIQTKCNQWYSAQPDKNTYAPREMTASISRLIRNYTAFLAMNFAVEFLDKTELIVPEFIKTQKAKNAQKEGERHREIPVPKYLKSLGEICLNTGGGECDLHSSDYGGRWGTFEFVPDASGSGESKDAVASVPSVQPISKKRRLPLPQVLRSVTQGGGRRHRKKTRKRRKKKSKKKKSKKRN